MDGTFDEGITRREETCYAKFNRARTPHPGFFCKLTPPIT